MNKRPDMDVEAAPAPLPAAATPEPGRGRRRMRVAGQLLLVLVLLALGLAGWKVIMALAPQPHVRKATRQPLAVEVVRAQPVDIRPTWTLYGEVVAARTVALQMPVSGRIVRVSPQWKEGAQVGRGEELLRVDDLAYRAAVEEAQARLKEAEAGLAEARQKVASEKRLLQEAQAQFRVAEREFARVRTLVARGTLPQAKLDQQRQQFLIAREKLESRKQMLASARARLAAQEAAVARLSWALKKAQDNLEKTVLRAPFDGQLAQVQAEVGQQAGPGVRLATLMGGGAPEVLLRLPEARLLTLKRAGEQAVGRKVEVVVATRGGAVPLAATIQREGAQVDRNSGALSLYAVPDDRQQAAWLKPGTFVEVHMKGPLLKGVVLLPEAAIADGNHVMVVRDGRLARLPVKVLGLEGGRVIVAGVPAGAMVVRHRLAQPEPGKPVRIVQGMRDAG